MIEYNSNGIPENHPMEDCAVVEDNKGDMVDKSSGDVSPTEQWIQKNPSFRREEISFFIRAKLGYPYNIMGSGDLHQPFKVSGWTFLLVIDKCFPRKTEQGELPIKVYLVNPGILEFNKLYNMPAGNIPCIRQDSSGMAYLDIEEATDDFNRYVNNLHNKCMSETMVSYTIKWVDSLQKSIKQEKIQQQKERHEFGNPFWYSRLNSKFDDYYPGLLGRAKYFDGRGSRLETVNPKCQKIILTDRAFIQIYNESRSKIKTETGGLLLGHFEHGVWCVIEASDPGINAVFRVAYHEGDDVYQNHVCDVISRIYKHPLVFLGMWHRHPGSLDSFSGTDDGTNYKYAASAGNGCISAIINFDPDFRITFYYVEQEDNHNVRYTKVDVEVGDDRIPNKEMMRLADLNDVKAHMN